MMLFRLAPTENSGPGRNAGPACETLLVAFPEVGNAEPSFESRAPDQIGRAAGGSEVVSHHLRLPRAAFVLSVGLEML